MPIFGDTNTLLAWVGAHGPQALGVIAFLCALGVPLPITILVLATGALARHGLSNLGEAIFACFAGSLIGEALHYAIGATAGAQLRNRTRGRLRRGWAQAEARFHQGPAMTIFLSRFILAPIGLPTNWIAGSSGYSLWRFLFWSFWGNATWILTHAAAGYWLGDSWQHYKDKIETYRVWIIGVAVVAILVFVLWRREVARAIRVSEAAARAEAGARGSLDDS